MKTYIITLTVTGDLSADDAARIRDRAYFAAKAKADDLADLMPYGYASTEITTKIELR